MRAGHLIPARDDRNSCAGASARGNTEAGDWWQADHPESGLRSTDLMGSRRFPNCRTARFSETPSIISGVEREGAFDDQRSAGNPPQAANSRSRAGMRGCQQDLPILRDRQGELLPLWTALPLQVGIEAVCGISCKHLSGVSWLARAPKWGIRTRAPLQLVGLVGLDKSQARRASVRSVQPISPSARKLADAFRRRRGNDRRIAARPRLSVRSCWRPQPSRG